MAGFMKSTLRLADRIALVRDGASAAERSRIRALVIWTVLAVPIGVSLILFAKGGDVASASSLCVLVGGSGMVFAIYRLRKTKNLEEASTIFIISGVIGLGVSAWIDRPPSLVPLIFLAATPVYFGLIVRWQKCLLYTSFLVVFYLLLALWVSLDPLATASLVLSIIACGMAALGVGLSTTAYANTTERAARKVQQQAKEITAIAYSDPLTGIGNRRAFKDAIQMQPAAKDVSALAVIDLDSFKPINDTYGHEVGDEVLLEIAHRLSSIALGGSKVYRLGGDEFVFIADTSLADCEELGRSICAACQSAFQTKAGPLSVDISVGVATLDVAKPCLSQSFREADLALYEAKRSKGTGWTSYCEGLGALTDRNNRLTELLKRDLDQNDLSVDFQPQYDVQSGQIIGFEALARWTIDEFGRISPGEFVPLAERANLITQLDQSVFRKAIMLAQDWLLPSQKVAVNVSGRTLLSPGFVEFVEHLLAATSLANHQIQVEITETEIIENEEAAVSVCSQLRALGVSITLDDFGTGFSSLSYLSALPVNALKIDRSFVQQCDSESNLKILRSIIGLARSLGLNVVVEGVEQESQLKVVRRLGCRHVQGFYFSRPIAPDACRALNRQTAEDETNVRSLLAS
jgi:diguanylate cyclase (GGDEF)-like protein